MARASSSSMFSRCRQRLLSISVSASGMNEPRSRPQACRRRIHSQSSLSVFGRPFTLRTSLAFTSRTSNPSRRRIPTTGNQNTPVASMATVVTPCCLSHWANSSNSDVYVPNFLTGCCVSFPAMGAQATMTSLCRSSPAAPGWMTSSPLILRVVCFLSLGASAVRSIMRMPVSFMVGG